MSRIILKNHWSSEEIPSVNYRSQHMESHNLLPHIQNKKTDRFFICYARYDFSTEISGLRDYLSLVIPNSYVYYDNNKLKGEKWKKRNYYEIRHSNIMIVIITPASLYSKEIKNEISLAKQRRKRIIPCKDENLAIDWNELPWNMENIDGISFDNTDTLKRKLYREINRIRKSIS